MLRKIGSWFSDNRAVVFWALFAVAVVWIFAIGLRPYAVGVGNTFSSALQTGAVDWPKLVAAIAVSLASLIVPFIAAALIWFACDTFVYYRMYRRPYLLVLFGRQLPHDDNKAEFDAASVILLQNAVRKAVEWAQRLLAPPIESWNGTERFLDAMWAWQSEQFGLIQRSFNRLKGRDTVRAFLLGVRQSGEDSHDGRGDLVFLPVRKVNPSPPLRIEGSIAGRTILQTVGEALAIVNVANALLDPDFVPHGSTHGFRSLLCVPILYQDKSNRLTPLFVLSIDSRLDEAFPPEHVTAARAIAACIGLVTQRFVDVAEIEAATKKSEP